MGVCIYNACDMAEWFGCVQGYMEGLDISMMMYFPSGKIRSSKSLYQQ